MALDPTMVTMIHKTRALSEDMLNHSVEVFTYSNSPIWTLAEPHIFAITQVLLNGNTLISGQGFSWNPVSNKITFTGIDFVTTDVIEVDYSFTKYSDTEIMEYIRAALVWLSIYDYSTDTFHLRTDGIIVPTPEPKTLDLVCIIASILIKPNYIHYRMPNLAINYPNKMTQEEKIRDIITYFKRGVGVVQIIEWNRSPGL